MQWSGNRGGPAVPVSLSYLQTELEVEHTSRSSCDSPLGTRPTVFVQIKKSWGVVVNQVATRGRITLANEIPFVDLLGATRLAMTN